MKTDSLRARKWRDLNPEAYHEQSKAEALKLRLRRAQDPEYNEKIKAANRESYHRLKHDRRRENMLGTARRRSKVLGFPFDLDIEDIIIPTVCPILGVELVLNEGKPHANSASLDRKDASKGYIKGNVWVISRKANAMKYNATMEELRLFAAYVARLDDNFEFKQELNDE